MTQTPGSQQYWQAPKVTQQPSIPQWAPPNGLPLRQPRPQQPTVLRDPELRQEAQAALGAYRDLGPEYEDAVVSSFLARVDQRLGERTPPEPLQPLVPQASYVAYTDRKGRTKTVYTTKATDTPSVATFGQITAFVATVLGLAIPLTSAAADTLGFFGLIIAWIGIMVVGVKGLTELTNRRPDERRKELGG
jgi:hypothetical protein